MTLGDLIGEAIGTEARHAALAVSGIAIDSRKVKPGDVFFALAGAKTDGAKFAEQAAAAGAVVIVSGETVVDVAIPQVTVGNPRRALALAAAKLYPHQPEVICAVTGTSGKTSVADFTRQIWTQIGHPAASVGTVGVVSPRHADYGTLTTPDPVELHRTLDQLAGEGVKHLILEASSHGLDQHRLDGVKIAAGAFTNLSRDHMDYHPTVEAYLAAKIRLFSELVMPGGAAVIASGHPESAQVESAARKRGLTILTVGHEGAALRLLDARVEGYGQHLRLAYEGQDYPVALPLAGAFQVENALVAAGLALATGSTADRVFHALENLKGAKGRLERVGEKNGAPIFVDYAHKPDALAKALDALRPFAKKKLVVVFGAGGDRDPGKRSLMGEIAAAKADRVIVTDDNPRSENAAAIRAAILKTAPRAEEIGDRAQAIRAAIGALNEGDALLIAGKGHETGQIVGERVLPFSDHEAVAATLAEHAA